MNVLSGFRTSYGSENKPEKCISECQKRGFRYAGLQFAYNCFCGNTRPSSTLLRPSSQCPGPCPANRNRKCGGFGGEVNIYTTPDTTLSTGSPTVQTNIPQTTKWSAWSICYVECGIGRDDSLGSN